jgi:hypothetical protein
VGDHGVARQTSLQWFVTLTFISGDSSMNTKIVLGAALAALALSACGSQEAAAPAAAPAPAAEAAPAPAAPAADAAAAPAADAAAAPAAAAPAAPAPEKK